MKRLLLPFFLLTTLISTAQIRLVEDILPGVEQSNPFQFLEHDGFLFFIGQSTGGPAIFMMDTNETISIAWQEGFNAYDMVVYNNDLYFNANNQLHRLNRPYGTGAGSTVVDSSISMWGSAFVYNGELYFGGEINQTDPLNPNHELMAYNGSNVRLVEEVSSISLDPSQFVLHLGELYFVGKEMDMVNGQPSIIDAIYKSNGTVVEQVTSFLNTSVSYLTSLGDNLYFLYRNGDFNQPYNLWYNNTNGPGGFGVELNFAFGLTIFENKLFFFDQDNTQLVSRDILGNEEIIPIAAGLEYPLGGFPLQNQNYLAFSGFTNAFGSELYIYEAGGEINFTEDYNSGSNSFTPVYGSFFNGNLYVTGSDGSGIGRELHVYNPNGCTETVNIPNANFEAYLENVLNVGDGIVGNGLVCKEKVEVLTTLNLSGSLPIVNFPPGLGITNLSGIEHFSALEVLRVEGNNIATLNLSQNTNLRELRAWRCNIQTLNVSGLTNLQTVGLNFNSITTVDFATCPAIEELDITDNDLTSIQLGTMANLLKFTISNNPNLTSLDISGADTNLTTFNATGNTALTCIQVSNVANAENQANWLKDANTSYSTNCNPQPFTVTASIPGATGNPPAIEITEGNSFTLNFESGPTAPDGTPYTPTIQFTLNGNPGTADFSFNGNAALPTAPFTVTNPGSDGSITILALEDNLVEQDETYTITISSPDPSLFTIQGPSSFEVTVKDFIPEPLVVTPFLSLPVGQQDNTIQEGQTFRIFFEADDSEFYDNQSFDVAFNSISSSATRNIDFEHEDSPIFFTARFQQDAVDYLEVAAIIDNDDNEDEEIVIVLEKDPNNIYQWENADANGNIEFRITIVDEPEVVSDPFLVETAISGAQIDNDGNLVINEGETLSIGIKALPPASNTFEYDIRYDLNASTATVDVDFIPENNPKSFFVQENVSEDGTMDFFINRELEQSVGEADETIIITLFTNEADVYNFKESPNAVFNQEEGTLTYTVLIKDVPPESSNAIIVTLENTGGVEGGSDTFTLSLMDSEGNPWTDHDGLEFKLEFKNEIIPGSDLEDYFIQSGDQWIRVAESDNASYVLEGQTSSPTEATIMIPGGANSDFSRGELTLVYPQEEFENRQSEFYSVTVKNPNSSNYQFSLPEPLQVNVRDDEGRIFIYVSLDQSNLMLRDGPGLGCCGYHAIEEGESLFYYFNAENGVDNTELYDLQLNFVNASNPYPINPEDPITPPASSDDYEIVGTLPKGEPNNSGNSEFNLQIKTILNDDNGDTNNPEVSEKFAISIEPVNSEKFHLIPGNEFDINNIGDPERESMITDFYIVETVLAYVEVVDDTVDEDNFENDKGQILIKLDEKAQSEITVSFTLEGTAKESLDYSISPENSVTFLEGEQEKTIDITAIQDNIPEGEKTIILTLIDGFKYSISENQNRGVVRISKNDEDKIDFDISLKALEASIYEEPDKNPNTAAFEITLTPKSSSFNDGENVIVNYSFIEDNETYFAVEGIDFTQNGDGTLIFENGELTKQILVTAILDEDVIPAEQTETITLSLTEGLRYASYATTNAKMKIISRDFDNSFLDEESLKVTVTSNSCKDYSEGDILIENDSRFDFNVFVQKSNSTENPISGQLKGIGGNNNINFKDLDSGEYTVSFKFSDPEIELIPPVFIVNIEELTGTNLLGQSINLKTRTAELVVNGSREYTVLNEDGDKYLFNFNDFKDHTIEIPVKTGLNNIVIRGEADCQGELQSSFYFNEYIVYPNPTQRVMTIGGFSNDERASAIITDYSGKALLRIEKEILNGQLELDLSNLSQGIYFAEINTNESQALKLKIVKN